MSEPHDAFGAQDDLDPGLVAPVLTSQSCAIAGFAFAVLSMLGQGTWTFAAQALLWSTGFALGDMDEVLFGWAAATLLLAGGAIVLARRTLADPVGAGAWEGHLARAAVIVAGVGLLLSSIGILGLLLHLWL